MSGNIILDHIIFFAVGFGQDLLITYYYKAIEKEHAVRSAWLSFVITLVNLTVLYGIISGIEEQVGSIILVYALGNAVATYFVVRKYEILTLLK